MDRYLTNTMASYQEDLFHHSTTLGMTPMAPPPLPRRISYDHYLGHNMIDDFGLHNNEPSISLPPIYTTETSLLTPLDLLTPIDPLRPGSPLMEMQQNLSAMQNVVSQRLLMAKEYGNSLAIEGAFRKAEWERDRVRRMKQTQGARSTRGSTSVMKNTPYIDWSPVGVAAVPPAHVLPSTAANRPRSRSTIPALNPTSPTESPLTEHLNSYDSSSIGTMQAASTHQGSLSPSTDSVPLTFQHRVLNPLTKVFDHHHVTISVASSVSLSDLKQVIWTAIQDGNTTSAPQAHLNGWIESLIVHWDVDKQVYHHFPPTTELRDESLECMLVCLRDVRGYDWVEVGFETA